MEKRVLTMELRTSFSTSPSLRSMLTRAQFVGEDTFSVHAIAETTQNIVKIPTVQELMI